jgi:pSer/pThr/pTyr-binding forkhead associated (FHA) protein
MKNLEKECPVCKNKNERQALVCIHCGAALEENIPGPTITSLTPETSTEGAVIQAKVTVDEELIPADGIALYFADTDKRVSISIDREVVLGRKVQDTDDALFDLSALGGFQLGLSRRHAMIRRTETGYVILDLSSTNGTWLNNQRLVPEKPYPLTSGSQLRLGRMRIVLFHRHANGGGKT